MNRTLTVKHTADRHGQPLAWIENLPGEGAEFSAAQLRMLARTLEAIADECDRGTGVRYVVKAIYDMQGGRKEASK